MPLIRKLELAPVFVACAALFILMAMTFCDVTLRSLANSPIQAAPELTRILMAVIVFSVLPIVSLHDSHISVDLIDPLLRTPARRFRDIVMALACGLILIVPAGQVVKLAERARSYGDVTEYLAIPTFYIGWFIAIMTYATAVALIARALLLIFARHRLEPSE